MNKKIQKKINLNLLSGIFLGIIFIVACGAVSSSVKAISTGTLYLYDKNNQKLGQSLSSYTDVLLSDGFMTSFQKNGNVGATYFYFASNDCSGAPYMLSSVAKFIYKKSLTDYFYVASNATLVEDFSFESNGAYNPDTEVFDCTVASSTADLYPATAYTGSAIPTGVVSPYHIQ